MLAAISSMLFMAPRSFRSYSSYSSLILAAFARASASAFCSCCNRFALIYCGLTEVYSSSSEEELSINRFTLGGSGEYRLFSYSASRYALYFSSSSLLFSSACYSYCLLSSYYSLYVSCDS